MYILTSETCSDENPTIILLLLITMAMNTCKSIVVAVIVIVAVVVVAVVAVVVALVVAVVVAVVVALVVAVVVVLNRPTLWCHDFCYTSKVHISWNPRPLTALLEVTVWPSSR